MTKKITWMFVLLFSITLAYNCKKKDTPAPAPATTYTNADYAGTWNVSDKCPSSPFSYQITVTASGSNGLTITNFHGPNGWTLSATVSNTSLTIPVQTKTVPSGPYTFQGSGTFTPPSSLSISYTMKDASTTTLTCTAACTK